MSVPVQVLVTEVAKELCRQDVAADSSLTRDEAWRPQRDYVKDGYRKRAAAVVAVMFEVGAE